jgi:cell surface protein SprA
MTFPFLSPLPQDLTSVRGPSAALVDSSTDSPSSDNLTDVPAQNTEPAPELLASADLLLPAAPEPVGHLDSIVTALPTAPPEIQFLGFSSPPLDQQILGQDTVRYRLWLLSGGDTTRWRGLDSVSFKRRLDSLYIVGVDTSGMAKMRMVVLDSLNFRVRLDSLAHAGVDTAGMKWIHPDSVAFYAARGDTLRARGYKVLDTTYVVYLDSTTRLEQFTYRRKDSAYVSMFPRRTYPLFGKNNDPGYRREITLDTMGNNIRFRETVGGANVKVPLSMPLKDYIRARQKAELRALFANEARRPAQVMERNDLGELLSNITKIQIPIPPNPIFSIFGKPVINLNINGSVDIKAGFRNTKSDQTTISYLDQSRNEPDFSQEVQVGVNGTIGDKLNILADWNTQRTFEYENQLKIKYTGYEDEIVQSVEAGNVSLQTPSSFIGSSQALFGVKAKFQAGPLTLTTLASQKKGQIKEVAVSGGAKEQTFEMRAFEYSTNHYFVDSVGYASYYEAFYANDPPTITEPMQETQIVEEEVWVSRQGSIPDPLERQAIAFIELPERGSGYNNSLRTSGEIPGQVEVGPFVRLDATQYELDGDGYLGEISLNANVGDQQIIAIAYRTAGAVSNRPKQFGEFARDQTDTTAGKLILKMIKPKNLISNGPSYKKAWGNLLKNIYPIQGVGRNLKKNGFSLDIVRRVPGGEDQNSLENEPLLRVLGLDKYTGEEAQTATPDGQFDFRPGRTISQARAEIIFPTLRPFDKGIADYFKAKGVDVSDTTALYHEIYDTTQTFAQQSLKNRYVIKGKATGEASSRYSLGFNVVEGSVQVMLDGRALVMNVDYTVDYILGEVVIKNDRALVPGANLSIKYEQNDLFQLASKTLLGARGDLAIAQNTLFGFTIMNLNQQTLSDKVRLGEEPSNNTILGIDGSTVIDLPFLTRGLDALPLLSTREPSSLKISGEAAYMIPDPNTQKSSIPSDGGEGIAYIDDFEGSRRPMPVGIAYNAWSMASPPADPVSFPPGTPEANKMDSKGKMVWYNMLPTNVAVRDVYPRKETGNNPANNQLTVLDFHYYPNRRGTYNYSTDLNNTLTPRKNWGGVMKPLSVSAINLAKENINYIEIWMRVEHAPTDGTGKMLIDLGAISERADPSGPKARGSDPNSEDLVLSAYPNGTLQEGEDVGIDMRSDAQERVEHAALIALYPELANDPSGDDYYFNNQRYQSPSDYDFINGTENNKDGPAGRIPDTEDLNSNGTCDQANSYFEYEVSLDTTGGKGGVNPQIVGGGSKGWYQFRIPIQDYTRTVGSPTQENIEFIRVLFVDATDTIAVRIADFGLVGNQWQKVIKNNNTADTTFAVSVVSVEDNPDYKSPPGVIRERDKTQTDQIVLANEQSLALVLRGLPDGTSGEAARYYTYKALDLFDYRIMKMFIHGDEKFNYVDENNYDAEVFFRFGLDSLNYYEYRAPVHKDWDPQNDIVIKFADVTAIKQSRDSTTKISDPVPVKGGPPGAYYRVLGNPSLTQVVYLSIGVTNPLGKGTSAPLEGQVWANELRLTSVDDSKGWAYRFDGQLKLADLGSVAFNYSRVDPNFHSLEQRFGSRQLSTSWALSTNVQLEKFFPQEWTGTTLPFSYSHTESLIKPRYLPNSDVLVDEAATQLSQKVINKGGSETDASAAAQQLVYQSETRRISDTYAAPNFRIGFPSQAWYVRDIVNKIGFGFSFTKSQDRSPALVRHTAWSWNARINYQYNFAPDNFVQPFKRLFEGIWLLDEYKDMKIFYTPASFSWALTTVRSRDVSLQRTVGAQLITSRNFTASRSTGFSWKATEGGLTNLSGDYSLSVESSLLDYELDRYGRQRSFSAIIGDIFGGDKLINFGKDTRYSQRNQFTSKPNIPNIFNLKKFLDFSFSYGVDYGWQNSLTKGDLGKSAGFNNNINFSMNLKLKALFDPLFENSTSGAPAQGQPPPSRGRRGAPEGGTQPTDSTKTADSTAGKPGGLKLGQQLKELARTFIKIPFLDYDNVSISFTQTNNAQNNGIVGTTGFLNFWGKVPFFQNPNPYDGPSRLYQLGLISDPTGKLTNFRFTGKPPFFAWDVAPGVRAANGVLVNSYRENNRLTFKTSRALWEGARIDLNWNVGWNYSRQQNITTDSLGMLVRNPDGSVYGNMTSTGSVDRSFLTFPDVLFLGMFKTGLKQVSKLYSEMKSTADSSKSDEEKLAQAFEQGFEAMPIMRKLFGQFYPRVNWSFRWDGLEKLPLFAKFVSRLSLDHAYQGNFTRQFQNRPGGGGERTDAEHVGYGFAPLVGLNFTFKELAKGNIGATVRYNTNTSYDLALSARNIVETLSQELSVTASYSRKGFEIPFFGLALNNDIDISAQYSVTKNSRTTYDVAKLDVDVTGTPLEGTTRTVMEPRIKYVLSARVTASVYYRYTKIAPDDSGSRIPGTTTNEAGLDIHISIQ